MKKYFAYVRLSIQNTFAYRGAIAVWITSNIITLVMFIAVWTSAASNGSIAGYSKNGLVMYYITSLFLQWATNWFPFYWLKDEISDGSIIGAALLKPISNYWRVFAIETGWHLVTIFIGLLATLLVAIPFQKYIYIPTLGVNTLFVIATSVLAIFVVFTFSMCQALLAFWFTKINSVDSFFWIGRFLFGGQGMPISFLPPLLILTAHLLPFRYMFSFPLEIFLNQLSISQIINGSIIQIIWILCLGLLYSFMWKKGLSGYSAFGH